MEDKLGFNDAGRYLKGKMAEDLVMEAYDTKSRNNPDKFVIPNDNHGLGPQVTAERYSPRWKRQVEDNAKYGDSWFIYEGTEYKVDVKAGLWIADDSLEKFVTVNSYYAMGMFRFKADWQYFMILADQYFRDFMKDQPIVLANGSPGRVLNIDVFREDDHFSSANGSFFDFDIEHYRSMVVDKMDHLEKTQKHITG